MDPQTEAAVSLDSIDHGVLYALQERGRYATHEQISDQVGASASTVRNRITRLEYEDVISGYTIRVNYERAGFPLRLQFICTADVEERNRLAREVLAVCGVVNVREMLTSEQNLVIEVVATGTENLSYITNALHQLDIVTHSSEIIANSYDRSFSYFQHCSPGNETNRHEETAQKPDECNK
jgi:DNA-binding Lrp family transcriptional regulator